MLKAKFTLENAPNSPLSFGRVIEIKKAKNESYDEYEERTWAEKAHKYEDGTLFIPAISMKHSLEGAAKWKGEKIAGKGKATYGKRFLQGIRVLENAVLKNPDTNAILKAEDLEIIRLFSSSDGKTNSQSGKVWKWFPIVKKWKADFEVLILDTEITKDVFESHLRAACEFVGLLRWRPANGGYNGMSKIIDLKFEKYEI